jgi:hypothetical protein
VAHATKVAALSTTKCGDNRYYNNIFVGGVKKQKHSNSGLSIYKNANQPMQVNGNVYLNDAIPYQQEDNQLNLDYDPKIAIVEKEDGIYLSLILDKKILKMKNALVTSDMLGTTLISGLPFENADGTALRVDMDFFGNSRDKKNPTPGPFEKIEQGKFELKVW